MYCHNFHVVLSDGDFFFARSSMSCPWVISHMMTMSPNPSSLFHRDLFYVFGDVFLYSAVSRWVSSYVVASSLWHVVIGSLVMILLFSHIFILVIVKFHKMSTSVHQMSKLGHFQWGKWIMVHRIFRLRPTLRLAVEHRGGGPQYEGQTTKTKLEVGGW